MHRFLYICDFERFHPIFRSRLFLGYADAPELGDDEGLEDTLGSNRVIYVTKHTNNSTLLIVGETPRDGHQLYRVREASLTGIELSASFIKKSSPRLAQTQLQKPSIPTNKKSHRHSISGLRISPYKMRR